MPTLGNNLQTSKDYIISQLEGGTYLSKSSVKYTDLRIIRALNYAQTFVRDQLEIGKTRDTTTDALAVGQNLYNLPEDVMGHKVHSIEVLDSAGTDKVTLTLISEASARTIFDLDNLTNGTPAFAVVPADNASRQYRILPPPDYAAQITVVYSSIPTPLRRLYNQINNTAVNITDITNGSAAVTVSADLSSNPNVAANDEFGIIDVTTMSDGVARPEESPIDWYRILSVGSSALTLSENYIGTTIAAGTAKFVIAQVSDLERAFPGKFHSAMDFIAVAFLTNDRGLKSEMNAQAQSILQSFKHDEYNRSFDSTPATNTNYFSLR